MTLNRIQKRAAGLLAAFLLCTALPAGADIMLSGRLTVAAGHTPPAPSAVSLFCQGANTRLETSGGPTLLYDGKANILYAVSQAARSYSLSVPVPADPADEVSLTADEIKIETKLDLRGTGRTQTLAGLPAHQYAVSGTIRYTRLDPKRIAAENQDAEDREQDARRRRYVAYLPPQWAISGEIWLADTAKLPADESAFLAVPLVAAGAGPFGPPFADALSKRRGLPLLARITVTHTPPLPSAAPVVTQTDFAARAVSEAPLNPALFQEPLSYALVAAPLNPYTPGVFSPAAP